MSNNSAPVVVGIGEILWDVFPNGKQLGGAPANFAYHTKSLGSRSFVVSSVGDDSLGEEIFQVLDSLGLSRKYVDAISDRPTGTVTVEVDGDGKPEYVIHEDVAWDNIALSDDLIELAKSADAVCFGSLAQRCKVSRETINTFLENTRPECLRVFDINLRQNYFSFGLIEQALGHANVLKLNDEELPVVSKMFGFDGSEEEQLQSILKKFDLSLIVLTKGSDGSLLYSENEQSFSPCEKIEKIADTVGAGDSFTASVVMGLLNNRPLENINAFANKVAAFVCSQHGATPVLPDVLKEQL